MKRTKRVLCLLIAVIFIFGITAPVSAAIPGKSIRKYQQDGKDYGAYPQYSGYDALNKAIENDIWLTFNGVVGGLDFGLTRDPGAFSNSAARNWVEIVYEETDSTDWFTVTVTVKITYHDKRVRLISNTYYVNTKDKSFSKDSAKYDDYMKDGGASAGSTPALVPPPSQLDQAADMFKKIISLPILPDATGYVSLKRYAAAVGGSIGISPAGDIIFTIENSPIYFAIDDAVWEKNVNVNLYAPIYVDDDDVLVHASLVYPVYGSKVTVDTRGYIVIIPK